MEALVLTSWMEEMEMTSISLITLVISSEKSLMISSAATTLFSLLSATLSTRLLPGIKALVLRT